MQRLIDTFSNIDYPRQITVFNANPEIDLTAYISKSLANINLINADTRKYMLHRYKLAYESNYNNFLLVDDDLFYTTRQINKLIEYYLAEPQFIHGGGFGQKIIGDHLQRCYPYYDGFVDVVGRIYCFSRKHLEDLKLLLDRLNIDFDYPKPGCDILLSFSGRPEQKPKCHNLGRYKNCHTSDTPGIAVYKTDGFHSFRNELIKQIYSAGYL